jgi:hypothetical protein
VISAEWRAAVGVLAGQAAHVSHGGQGLFLSTWGLLAAIGGLALVTDFHGAATRYAHRQAQRKRPRWARQQPAGTDEPALLASPEDRILMMRVAGGLFAVLGPIVLIAGLISIAKHGAALGYPPIPGPFRYLFLGFGAVIIGVPWLRPNSLARQIARRGGWRLAAAVVSGLGSAVFIAGLALGQSTAAMVALLAGGLVSMALVLDKEPTGPPAEAPAAGADSLPGGPGFPPW